MRTDVDRALWLLLITLTLFSCIMLYSSSKQDIELVLHQGVKILIGFSLMAALMRVPINVYRWWAPWFYASGILLLCILFLFGNPIKGAQRWLDLGIVRFQPSEILKIATPLLLCLIVTSESSHVRSMRFFLAALLLTIPVVLVAIQPDLGTAFLIAISGLIVIFLAGIAWKWILGLIVAGVLVTPLIWSLLLDYQKKRLLTFLNPEQDPFNSGYHIIQSKIAIGSGGLWGKGWLNGTQSQLDFIPERSTDFIFAAFAEEFGFIGVCVLLLTYFLIIGYGIRIAVNAADEFDRLLAASLILAFAAYVFVNISMVSGIVPVVGVPLPLISYGGTSMITLLASFGILMAVSRQRMFLKQKH